MHRDARRPSLNPHEELGLARREADVTSMTRPSRPDASSWTQRPRHGSFASMEWGVGGRRGMVCSRSGDPGSISRFAGLLKLWRRVFRNPSGVSRVVRVIDASLLCLWCEFLITGELAALRH